jgi:hypothetical protein
MAGTASAVPTFTDSPTPRNTRTPTRTATPATPTPTATPTPGEGVFLAAGPFIGGNDHNSLRMTYKAGSSAWNPGGLLTLFFPAGLGTPSAGNFYVEPSQAGLVSGYSWSGQTVTVQVNGLAANASLIFLYGYDANGFFVSSTHSSEAFAVFAYPESQISGLGGQVKATPPALKIHTATLTSTVTPSATPTRTPTATRTARGTFTETSTITVTAPGTFTVTPTVTATVTLTLTPIGVEEAGVYSYPNPFDMSRFDKCTFRFPADDNARITVFNLLGEPVREIPSSDIKGPQGWAVWYGRDDRLRKVQGGLYYMRVTGKNTLVRKFTVLN